VRFALLLGLCLVRIGLAQELKLPPRRANAVSGSEFASEIKDLPQEAREERIWQAVTSGNVPEFLRHLAPVRVSAEIEGRSVSGRFFAAPDYLAVGSDRDYFFVPLSPYTAQRLADRLGCTLPTPSMVDAIYHAAGVKLTPSPIPPSPAMTTVPVFLNHNATVALQRQIDSAPLGALTAGDKKDIVICRALKSTPGHVAIYGWHKPDGSPIQPLYLGHFAYWADYSHGTRLVGRRMEVDGKPTTIDRILSDPKRCGLLSNEGPLTQTRYVFKVFPHPDDPTIHLPAGENIEYFHPIPGVRVMLDEPAVLKPRVRLVIYALPNGNTIEQTFGRRLRPDDDWHYDIQHIGAQTRFVRARTEDESLVVAYLEADNHAWPAWLRTHGAATTSAIYDAIKAKLEGHELRVALDSHSGGGAFLFDFIASADRIPPEIDRIAFLDSEYDYEPAVHLDKLNSWLAGYEHYLCAIAYDDASARLDGKPFVTAEGGTWGRSHAMLADLGRHFQISRVGDRDPERYVGLDGHIVFLLKRNPKAQIFHTVQVERNGFIESLLSGASTEEQGYRYFGDRAYSSLIHD